MAIGNLLAKYRLILISLFLASITFGTFWPVLKHDFVHYDDDSYVTKNQHLTEGITLQNVVWAFSRPHYYMWHPVTTLSYLLDYELFGLNPYGYHLTSLLLHIANILLLFWILKWLTGAVWPSAFVAAIFGVHPLQVESVAWVAERKNVMSALFWMLTIAAYIRYTKRPGIGRYLLIVLTFSLGLMAKPTVVTLPCVLLLLDYWPIQRLQWHHQSTGGDSPHTRSAMVRQARHSKQSRGKAARQQFSFWRLLGEKIPLFILAAVASAITYIVQQRSGCTTNFETLPVSYRAANAVISYATYIEKMIWPSGLAVLYPHPKGDFSMVWLAVSVLLLAVISVCCVYFAGSRKYLMTGWLWYLGILVPVIGLVQSGAQARADRYVYIPMVGLLIMVAWGVGELIAKWRYRGIMLVLSAVVIISAAMVCASLQLRHWQNTVTLFTHTLDVKRDNYIIHYSYAEFLGDLGRTDEAIEHYNKCLQIWSNYADAHNNLGVALVAKGRIDEGIVHFEKAIELAENQKSDKYSPNVLDEARYNLANALRIQGRFEEAAEVYAEALKLMPEDIDTLGGFGLTLVELKRFDEAIKCYRKMLEIEPNNVLAHGQFGLALVGQGKADEAIEQFRIVLSWRPDDVEMLCNVGILLEKQGKIDEAIKEYRRALEVNPAYDKARQLLDAALAKQNSQKIEK
jgi:tetratricopeptide (TPR) repeat protein